MNPTTNRAKDLFLDALALDAPADRAAFLGRACGDDAALRADVDGLLAHHAGLGSFLASGPADPDRTAAFDAPTAEGPGATIGAYKLLEQIGEGGFGVVFLAEQTHPVRRRVALKVLKPGMDTRQVVARFEAERQALAILDHPNIAKVFDGGATASGRPFFVMELVKGVPVTEFCDRARLAPRPRLELFVQMCHAVQHAHQKGLIHRDLKPSNVLVSRHDTTQVVKVIDFGVAKALGQELTDKTLFTGLGQMIGTPLYMSPEQAGMSDLDVDTRSDIYSLGVLLYELLTGTTPFPRERFKRAACDEIRRIIREEEPPRPSTRLSESTAARPTISANRDMEPAKLARLVRGDLDWIVMKALEKDRNRRYETADAFALDVQRYLADEPVLACPPAAGYRLRKFARRNRGRLAVFGGVFLAVLVMAASIGWAVRDRAARRAAGEQAETARLATVDGRVRASVTSARTWLAENKPVAAREKFGQARTELGTDGPALPHLAAEIAAAEVALDRFQQFLDLIERARQAETAPFVDSESAATGSRRPRKTPSPIRTTDRRPALAVPFVCEALQSYGILERDDWTRTLDDGFLGRQQVEQIRRLAYEELLWLADDVVRRQREHPSERPLSPQAAGQLGLRYLRTAETAHRPTRALFAVRARCHKALADEAAAQVDAQRAEQTAATIALDHWLRGQAAYDAKQLEEGLLACEAALRLDPTHYWSMMWLGYCLCDLGRGPDDLLGATRVFTGCILNRPDHAHAYYCRAIAYAKMDLNEKALADSSRAVELEPRHASAWDIRGWAHGHLGQWTEAVAAFDKAIELDPTFRRAWSGRALARLELGRTAEALADFDKAVEVDPASARAWFNRGWAYNELGQPDKAVRDSTQAIKLDPTYAVAWHNRGLAHNKLAQPETALADFNKTVELDPAFAQAWFNRAVIYGKLNQPAKALADYDKAIELDPGFAEAWHNRGSIHTELKQLDKALADFTMAIGLDPKDADAWFNRGVTLRRLGRLDQAAADYSAAIALGPPPDRLIEAYRVRAVAYDLLAKFELAGADYLAVVERVPKSDDAHAALAWFLATCRDAKWRDPDRAVAFAKKAVELAPKKGNHRQVLALAHYRARDWPAALAELNKSAELRKGDTVVDWFLLAMVQRKLGNHDAARKAYGQAIEWMEKNKKMVDGMKRFAEHLQDFRSEAEAVLELNKK